MFEKRSKRGTPIIVDTGAKQYGNFACVSAYTRVLCVLCVVGKRVGIGYALSIVI
jgi:hypothetical protein